MSRAVASSAVQRSRAVTCESAAVEEVLCFWLIPLGYCAWNADDAGKCPQGSKREADARRLHL